MMPPLRLHARHRLDITAGITLRALAWSLLPGNATRLALNAAREWSPANDALVATSVRSAFDLLLQALALPAGWFVNGAAQEVRGAWVLPLATPDPTGLIERLRAAGIDAARGGTTSIAAIGGESTPGCERLLGGAVFVPCHARLGDSAVERIAAALASPGGEPVPLPPIGPQGGLRGRR